MKIYSFHYSLLGSFAPPEFTGIVNIHDSPRYAKATDEQLTDWLESKIGIVRDAAKTEIASRRLAKWRKS